MSTSVFTVRGLEVEQSIGVAGEGRNDLVTAVAGVAENRCHHWCVTEAEMAESSKETKTKGIDKCLSIKVK